MSSIKERLLQGETTITTELTLDEFTWSIVRPAIGNEYNVDNTLKVKVLETSYYKDAKLGIIRLSKIN